MTYRRLDPNALNPVAAHTFLVLSDPEPLDYAEASDFPEYFNIADWLH